jgi:hypothetical protein
MPLGWCYCASKQAECLTECHEPNSIRQTTANSGPLIWLCICTPAFRMQNHLILRNKQFVPKCEDCNL